MYGVFNSRFNIVIILVVLTAIVVDSWYIFSVAVLHCFFVPQIIRNVRHNYKNSMKPSVYLSIASGRLALVLYIFGCPANFLVWKPKYWLVSVVSTLIVLQVVILALQRVCGPRFIIPRRYKPEVYSYYKALPNELELAEQLECSICLFPVNKTDRLVMTTPCNHSFHSDCLTHWMGIKLQCPTCRTELPFVDE